MANGCGKRKKDGRRYVRTKLTRTSPLKSARVMSLSKSLSAASSTTAFLDKSASARVIELPKSSNTMAGWERKGKEREASGVGWLVGARNPHGGERGKEKGRWGQGHQAIRLVYNAMETNRTHRRCRSGSRPPHPALSRASDRSPLRALLPLFLSLWGPTRDTQRNMCSTHTHTYIYMWL